jgi:squalene monooxygenase
MNNNKFDVCIIGAGVAGGTLAAYLGASGKKVMVIEKMMGESDKIIGELLQPGGVEMLHNMNLQHLIEGIDAQIVTGYGLFYKEERIQVSYPTKEGKIFTGRGFRYGKFISSIRKNLKSIPNVTLVEGNVIELIEAEGKVIGVKYIDKHSDEEIFVEAYLTIACDGSGSLFRKKLSDAAQTVSSHFLGLEVKNENLPYHGHGHVMLLDPSPCLCYPISSEVCRVLIDFPTTVAPRKSEELVTYLKEKIAPQFPEEIRQNLLMAIDEGKFKIMPASLVPARPKLIKGAILLGDSFNMRHPLTGGGMTVALTDVYTITNLIKNIDLTNDQILTSAIKEFYDKHHYNNASINILADALYGVMLDPQLKQACFEYLKRGNGYAAEPITLLSAISRKRSTLLKHFFSVAFFGVNDNLKYPTPSNVGKAFNMIKNALQILNPLMLNEQPGVVVKSALKVTEAILK